MVRSQPDKHIVAFGPVVNYNDPTTWTDEVKRLYDRLGDGDCTALAPLVAIDIEFLTDQQAMRALVTLKYDPDFPDRKARAELRKTANVLIRRPRKTGWLPEGDVLLAGLRGLVTWIENHDLLDLKDNREALERRILDLLSALRRRRKSPKSVEAGIETEDGRFVPAPSRRDDASLIPQQRERRRWCKAFLTGLTAGSRRIRTARSWALQTIAEYYGTDPKTIGKKIARDPVARAMRMRSPTTRRPRT